MGVHQVVVDHGAQIVVGQLFDLGDLMRGAEAVEKVQERHAGFERGRVRDQRHIHYFLHRIGTQHGKPGRPRRHHVAVIAENRKRLRRQRPRRDVKHGGSQLTRNLVHVRDHQQQTLRGGKGCG